MVDRPARTDRRVRLACLLGLLLALGPATALAAADEAPAKPAAAAKTDAPPSPGAGASDKLSIEQQQIGDRFKRFEEVLLRMAELSAATDPRRSALLRRAVAQGKDRLIGVQLDTLVELLKKDQLARALENQTSLEQDLQALLDLLMSENRAKRLESEKARIREYLRRLGAIINQQKGIQGRTAGGGEPKELSGEQARLADRTGDLAKDVKANEEETAKPGEPAAKKDGPQPREKTSGQKSAAEKGPEGKGTRDGPSGKQDSPQPKSGAKEASGGQAPPKGQTQPKGQAQGQAKGQGAKQARPGGEDQQQGESSEGQSQSPEAQDHPARQRLEAAQNRMREAEEKLKQAEREGAVEKQEEAIRELEQARAALEEILRQLREEELQRMLTTLEARFTKMLQMQREVLDGTVRLDKIPKAERTHEHEIQSGRLSSKEAEIDLEAEKALTLLREDGTAMAFPEALGQVRQDIQDVVQRLAAAKIDQVTQGVEQDIVAALEEMLQALKKALKDREKKRQSPMGMPGEPQEPPLVDALAELRMIRTLQLRVNLRTERYSKLIQGEQAEQPELLEALKGLAERQERIFRITRDLNLGKNR